MKRLLGLLVATAFPLVLSGCIVHGHDHGRGHSSHASSRSCHPSQYWDGHQCRHKGKGHGARKHDGRKK
ncbi:MAG TPA: hypothetical protein VMZ28_29990 [Kofleriaceae bacterium]|nr:hypothetical protein [Kofleriaceae bacterium]